MENYEGILRYAMQMELDGYNFFKSNADKFDNPTTRKLFLDLAETEMQHYNFIKHQLDKYIETQGFDTSEEVINREENIFLERQDSESLDATLEQSDIPDLTILRMAYLIERDFKEFYEDAAERVKDEDAKLLFTSLARWEKGHETIFKKEYDKRMKEYMSLPWGG